MKIVVTEYPKSGGNWIVNLLGDSLGLPKRDLYDVLSNHSHFDLSRHPWYGGESHPTLADSCVIKSHELPGSQRVDFEARYIHLVRDGRDVIVSRYFYEKDFCVANGIHDSFDIPFDEYVARVAREWCEYVTAWLQVQKSHFRYEEFLRDPAGSLRSLLAHLGLIAEDSTVERAVASNTREKMRQSLAGAFRHNTFVRKGISGDWRNHFSAENVHAFKEAAGPLLVHLGYETGANW